MTAFSDKELQQLAKTRKNTDVPAQWISALARELLEAWPDVRRYRRLRADGCTYGAGWYCNEKLDAVLDAEEAAAQEGK